MNLRRINTKQLKVFETLIRTVGPLTCRNILKAKKDYKLSRIPFLFSSIHPQLVVDVLHNDVEKLLEKILRDKKTSK